MSGVATESGVLVAPAPASRQATSPPAGSTGASRRRRRPGRWLLVAGVVLAAAVRWRFDWIPIWYLTLLLAAPTAGTWVWRRRRIGRAWRVGGASFTLAVLVLACPVPWVVAVEGDPPGNAWRLDGRLAIDGHAVDPAGEWYWLTVGRPATVAEVLWARARRAETSQPVSMRSGPLRQRAQWSEPAAAAIGLARGGWSIGTRYELHVEGALGAGIPTGAVIVALDDRPIQPSTDPAASSGLHGGRHTFTTRSGDRFTFDGPVLPYERREWVLVPTDRVDVVVGGRLATTPVGRWYRNLASGSSHGLMVALMAYTYASGEQLARGLAVAGTGTIHADGTVGRIRGLLAKAGAARDAGADVLLFPRSQADELARFDADGMVLVGVADLDEAIDALRSADPGR